jgi:phosphodiesterase/alkaline phosphatase D-like protein
MFGRKVGRISIAVAAVIMVALILGSSDREQASGQADGRSSGIQAGPFVGGVTDTSAVFIVKTSSPATVSIQVSEDSLFSLASLSEAVRTEESTYRYAKISLGSFIPHRRYYYRAIVNNVAADPVHSFRTFPSDMGTGFSFGFGSCQQGPWPSNPIVFPVIGRDTLLFFMQLGDWTYPDFLVDRNFATKDDLLARTYDMRYDTKYPFVGDVLSRMPIAYVYDDHDFTGNDSDGSAPGKANAIRAYTTFFPHYPLANPRNGLWQKFRVGDVEFFLLDLRSQRSPNRKAFNGAGKFQPPKGHSILAGYSISGTDQRAWLLESLKASTARWKVIASSVTFNPSYMAALKDEGVLTGYERVRSGITDKWAGFPGDVDVLVETIRKNRIKNVIIVSADAHSSFIDDGTHSLIPEIGSSNLDVPNSNIGALMALAGYNVWNKGGLSGSGYAYGRVSFRYGKEDHALLEIVDATGSVVAAHRVVAM